MCDSMQAWVDRVNREHDEKNAVRYIIKAMDALGWTEPQAMDYYEIPENERSRYKELVKKARAAQTDERGGRTFSITLQKLS